MEEGNNIDKIFQSSIENFEMKPPAKSWNSLEAELSKKRLSRKRNNFFRYFAIGLLLFLASFTAYKLLTPSPSSKVEKETNTSLPVKNNSSRVSSATIQSTIPSTTINSGSTVAKAEKQNSSANLNVNAKTMTASTAPGVILPAVVSHTTKVNDKYSTEEIKNTDPKTIQYQKSESVSNKNKSSVKTEQSLAKTDVVNKEIPVTVVATTAAAIESTSAQSKNTTTETPENKTGTEATTSVNEPLENKESNYNSTENIAMKVVAADAAINASSDNSSVLKESNENVLPSNVTSENSSTQTSPEHSDKAQEASATSTAISQSPTSATEVSNTQPVAEASQSTFKTIVSHLSAEVYYAPEFVETRLSVNIDYTGSASQNLNDYNNSSSEYSFSTGMNLRYDLGKKWSVASGLGYSTFVTTAVYNTIQVISDNDYQEVHGNGHGGGGGGHHGHNQHPHNPPNPNNDHHYVIHTPCGAIDLQNEPPHHGPHDPDNGDTLDIKTETHSTIQFLYIPLTARFQFGNGKFSYFVEAGGALNLVHDDLVLVTVNDSYTEDNYIDGLKTMNVSLLFGAGVQYNFYKGLSTFVKPTMRYSITPINQNNPVNSYPNYLGLGVGFSIHF